MQNTNEVYNAKRLFFKTNGPAFDTKEELTNLMVLIYEQNSYNDTFSVLQIQRFLDGSPRSENLATILEKIAIRNTKLDTIAAELDTLHNKISEEQFKLEVNDTGVKDWFVSVFESTSKMKNSISLLKEALNYKMETIEEIKVIFSKTVRSEEDFTNINSLMLKIKEFLDPQHLRLETIYAEIEDINETKLETIRNRICKARSPSLFQPSNVDNNQLSATDSSNSFISKK